MQVRQFREHRASPGDTAWLRGMLSREGQALGTEVVPEADGTLALRWRQAASEAHPPP